MDQPREAKLAVFLDFDNIALGAREARVDFDIYLLLQRLLEKGKIIVKRAYADWTQHKQARANLHQAAIELVEIPMPGVSGKNSADIRMVVDAMDLCHGNPHLDAFVIVSGDSDFSPLVSKLREKNKAVIGVGMKGSSSRLLIANCDEFIFYDDLVDAATGEPAGSLDSVPEEKREMFDFLLTTTQGLMREGRDALYSSLIKDTMKRKKPDFNESNWGYSTFSDLLEDAMAHGLLEAGRDQEAGGTYVVTSLGSGGKASVKPAGGPKSKTARAGRGRKSTSRRKRTSRKS